MFSMQLYDRLNQVNVCMSYPATLSLMDEVSSMHTVPLRQWITDGEVFKFTMSIKNKRCVTLDLTIRVKWFICSAY